jgi:tetratricopeptide (TPR) repeat protein
LLSRTETLGDVMHRPIGGTIILCVLVLVAPWFVAPTWAASPADHDACVKGSGDAAIAGCAAVIADRNEPDRSRAVAYFNRGYEWRAKGELDRAIADYGAAIELNPRYAPAYHGRGVAFRDKGDLDRALADHTMAIRIQPTPAVFTSRGDVWREKGDIDRAIIDYGEAIRLDAQAAAAFYRRGLAWREKDQLDRAISDYTSAIRLDPNHAEAYKNRGTANFEKGEFLNAASDLLHAVEIKDDPYLLLWRYIARGRTGQDGATELAVGAGRLTSKDWPFALVELYLGKRSPEEIRAATLKPHEMCEAAFFVGQFQLLRGNRADARPALQAATEICPKRLVEYDGAVAELRRLGVGLPAR